MKSIRAICGKKQNIMTETKQSLNFLEQIIEEDIRIRHAKSICLNHGLAKKLNHENTKNLFGQLYLQPSNG